MATSDVPAEAVEAVIRDRARRWGYTDNLDEEGMVLWLKHCADLSADLAAAAPHIHAQVLAEVDAVLSAVLPDSVYRDLMTQIQERLER